MYLVHQLIYTTYEWLRPALDWIQCPPQTTRLYIFLKDGRTGFMSCCTAFASSITRPWLDHNWHVNSRIISVKSPRSPPSISLLNFGIIFMCASTPPVSNDTGLLWDCFLTSPIILELNMTMMSNLTLLLWQRIWKLCRRVALKWAKILVVM